MCLLRFLRGYKALAMMHQRAGILLYPLKPRLHATWPNRPKIHWRPEAFQELNYVMKKHLYNARFTHTYLDEDNIGSMKALARCCHRRLLELRLLMRWSLRLRTFVQGSGDGQSSAR